MDSTQINDIVDKLADKIGIAAESIAPIAQEMVREISAHGAAQVAMGVIVLLGFTLASFGFYKLLGKAKTDEAMFGSVCGMIICGGYGLIAGMLDISNGISQLTAPTVYLLQAIR